VLSVDQEEKVVPMRVAQVGNRQGKSRKVCGFLGDNRGCPMGDCISSFESGRAVEGLGEITDSCVKPYARAFRKYVLDFVVDDFLDFRFGRLSENSDAGSEGGRTVLENGVGKGFECVFGKHE